ncbi:MAG: hypothetical protein CM15mP3_10050 [Candidatus Poseidoniales archaeon]|nr:MAG: hypothetical protein CM15mP3_10050 [Candidatus Poseidoniales archaeon]
MDGQVAACSILGSPATRCFLRLTILFLFRVGFKGSGVGVGLFFTQGHRDVQGPSPPSCATGSISVPANPSVVLVTSNSVGCVHNSKPDRFIHVKRGNPPLHIKLKRSWLPTIVSPNNNNLLQSGRHRTLGCGEWLLWRVCGINTKRKMDRKSAAHFLHCPCGASFRKIFLPIQMPRHRVLHVRHPTMPPCLNHHGVDPFSPGEVFPFAAPFWELAKSAPFSLVVLVRSNSVGTVVHKLPQLNRLCPC